jgi:hypothetical protein
MEIVVANINEDLFLGYGFLGSFFANGKNHGG